MKRQPVMHLIGRFKPCCSRGFTLIELMIGIALGLLIFAALISLYVNISRTNRDLAETNSLIDNGRFAIQVLENDIVHAGFWGTYVPPFDDLMFDGVPTDDPNAVPTTLTLPNPCRAYNATDWDTAYLNQLIGIPIQTHPYATSPPICAGVIANQLPNTDILVVRHAETCVPGTGNCEAESTGKLYFQASLCENEISASLPYILGTANFTLKNRGCTGTPPAATTGTVADKRKFISNIYYIRDYAITAGDGIPTLVRSKFDLSGSTLAHQSAEALIYGIEGFRVELGIDNVSASGAAVDYSNSTVWLDATGAVSTTDKVRPANRGDGMPDTFIQCTTAAPCTAAQLINVVTVKIYVLARSQDTTSGQLDTKTYCLGPPAANGDCLAANQLGPFDDRYQRRLFSTAVRLNNISRRRETQ